MAILFSACVSYSVFICEYILCDACLCLLAQNLNSVVGNGELAH